MGSFGKSKIIRGYQCDIPQVMIDRSYNLYLQKYAATILIVSTVAICHQLTPNNEQRQSKSKQLIIALGHA